MKLLRTNAERDEGRIRVLEDTEKKLQIELKAATETISAKDEQHKKCGESELIQIKSFTTSQSKTVLLILFTFDLQ